MHCPLRVSDERSNVGRGRAPEVHDDIGVNVGYLSIPHADSLQPALIDQPTSSKAIEFLENTTSARVKMEPRMTRSAPCQILLENLMHSGMVAWQQAEGGGQGHVSLLVQYAGIVSKAHIRAVDDLACAVHREQFA